MDSIGLEFVKCDLHVHTPASHDYADKKVSPEDFVNAALKKGLKVVAITDHNTGAFINKAQQAAKGTELTILPGVEISCSGGKMGIHVIALFDKSKDENTINALLAKANIPPEKYGAKDAISTKSVYDIIVTIAELGGLPVLAHCTSTKGVLSELSGNNRTEIFKSTSLLAVESSIAEYNDADKKARHKRAFDLLDGTDPQYNNRKLAVYSVSDSHSLDSIGNFYSFFKVDTTNITLESIRQCFIDRDVRIKQSTEYEYHA